ncbi:RNA-guided endonuclease IscB [uncultured Holdemanella sp.]|uniref:RNA-guided endonuclease IscB n=1 Tax=uncultured Holdemanella sp. TaxID=1763549 RepID=UPI0025E7967A|nr:RNA-guided endonuclease IscB [uncultured Holdemanella sp.]
MVYVLDINGQPLMPTARHGKVRRLLNSHLAKVVKRCPFTIQLLYQSTKEIQPVSLGVDAGSKHIGLAATIEQKVLYQEELTPRNDVVKLLSAKRACRHSRRNRKTRYRKPRFNNRVHSKHKGWLAPSVEVKIQEHITAIKNICKILPASEIHVETAEFDLQRLKAMEEGKTFPVGTDYQLGEQYDFYNTRQYVLHRDGYTCQCCGVHDKDVKLHVHHIESRQTGGNAPNNLITLCEHCHKALHEGKIKLPKGKKRGKSHRDAAFMGIMRNTLLERLKKEVSVPVMMTYGYITKYWREKADLEKSHINDAICISKHPYTKPLDTYYLTKVVRHHNRQIHKANFSKGGIRKRNQAPYLVKGFRLFDKVLYQGKEYFIFGRRTTGYFDIRTLDGTKANKGSVSYKKLRIQDTAKAYLKEVRAIPHMNKFTCDLA